MKTFPYIRCTMADSSPAQWVEEDDDIPIFQDVALFNLLSVDEDRQQSANIQATAFEHILHPAAFAHLQAVFWIQPARSG